MSKKLNEKALARLAFPHQALVRLLADNQCEPGACQWSYQAIADWFHRHLGPIKRLMKQCESLGYFVVERVPSPGRGHINLYRIDERFFLPTRVSKPPTGKKGDSESTSSTESAAARAGEDRSRKISPKIPRSPQQLKEAVQGWIGWLGEYVRDCEPENQPRFWQEAEARDNGKRSPWLNAMDLRARASAWYRERMAALRAGRAFVRPGAVAEVVVQSPPESRGAMMARIRAEAGQRQRIPVGAVA